MVNTPLNLETEGQDPTQTRTDPPPFIQNREKTFPLTSKSWWNTFLTGAQPVNRQVFVLGEEGAS